MSDILAGDAFDRAGAVVRLGEATVVLVAAGFVGLLVASEVLLLAPAFVAALATGFFVAVFFGVDFVFGLVAEPFFAVSGIDIPGIPGIPAC